MERTVILASRAGVEETHALPVPGTHAASLCGYRPSLHWQRLWSQTVGDPSSLPICPDCRQALVTA